MKIDIYKGSEKEWRSRLGVASSNQVVFIGVNPSYATDKVKDSTTKKIESYCKQYNYNGYYIINLYPQVEPNPTQLHINPKQEYIDINYNEIIDLLSSIENPQLIACWGESIELRGYLIDSLEEIKLIAEKHKATWYSIGGLLKSGHPRHPARSSLSLKKIKFDLDKYIIKMPKLKTISDLNITNYDIYDKNEYQTELTAKLDKGINEFNQYILNEIVLWKVNRYSKLDSSLFDRLNRLDEITNKDELKNLISELIGQKGIGLPMASTILRFLNPERFQIIDQRAFRVIYGRRLITPKPKEDQANLYLEYLDKLKQICKENSIPYLKADRILYYIDRGENKEIKLSNY